jgi:hypothetical protein
MFHRPAAPTAPLRRLPLVLALVLALLWAQLLGQAHGVRHAMPAAHDAPHAAGHAGHHGAAAGAGLLAHLLAPAGDEGDEGDCRLYDQLGHGGLLARWAALPAAGLPGLAAWVAMPARQGLPCAAFAARAPPVSR